MQTCAFSEAGSVAHSLARLLATRNTWLRRRHTTVCLSRFDILQEIGPFQAYASARKKSNVWSKLASE